MSWVCRKKGTLDLFLCGGTPGWRFIDDPQLLVCETPNPLLGRLWFSNPSLGPLWFFEGDIVELPQAKRELEEHKLVELQHLTDERLRAEFVAVKPAPAKTERPTDRVEVPEFVKPAETVSAHIYRSRSWSVPGTSMVWHHDEGENTAYLAGLMPEASKAHVLVIIQVLQEIAADMP